MAPDAPPRNCLHFMQIHNASVTLTQSASISCGRPSARSFCPGTPRRYFSYYRCLPGNGKRIWNGSLTRLQKCRFSATVFWRDDLPLLRPAHMSYVDGMNDDVVWCIKSRTYPSVCVIARRLALRHYSCSDHVCVMHAPDHVHTQRSQGSSPPPMMVTRSRPRRDSVTVHGPQRDQGSSAPPPHMMVTMCHNDVVTM